MVNKKFSAHGDVHAHFLQEKRILSISLSGPFNLEFILKYQRVVGAEREKIQVPCWASLVNVHGLALAPMEATADAQLIVDEAVDSGLVATAVVLHETEGLALQQKFWSKIYDASTLPFQFFSDSSAASDWLVEKIASGMQRHNVYQSRKIIR
ncbi:hypothetical protein FJN14_04835 [Alteromonas mediterranea]|uniref:hypothetical protein n=1 Tax=Alteromonas mediterranea TaxID=314275 RepID=UPI00113070D6|nr:hypothetical protein [Alteromonas mediterranea]QDG37816.1 hypothetical protein FJN14_04835 [Alteromonas mediterranea]